MTIAIFRNLRFNDSEERANAIQKELISKANVNDSVFFGSYEQDGNTTNGNEPIEWIILEKQNGKILLLSRYGLDMQKYSDMAGEISWENSLIRTWLNGFFIDSAFNKEDLNEILQTTLLNSQILDNGESEELQEKVDLEGKQTISLQKPEIESSSWMPRKWMSICQTAILVSVSLAFMPLKKEQKQTSM